MFALKPVGLSLIMKGLGEGNAKVRTGCTKPLKDFMQGNGRSILCFSKIGISSVEVGVDGAR